ncbi:MAG: M28 family metallopeptidase [Woeseia sp.]
MRNCLIAIVLATCAAACSGSDNTERNEAAIDAVLGKNVRTHMEVLAADAMQGREAGTAGYEVAADYVAGQLREYGLEPLGDDGSYFQGIEFSETRLIPESATLSLSKDGETLALEFPADFVRSGGYGKAREQIEAPLVFVGHGIIAPEYDHDDYAGVDVEGKILVMLSGAPPEFDTDQRAFYSSSSGKAERAVELGAVGIVGIRTPVDQARRPWARFLPGIGSPGMRWLDDHGRPFHGNPELAGSATLSETGADKLFALAGYDLAAIFDKHAKGETGSFDLGVSADLARVSTQRIVPSANVVAVLRGSDPALANEYVVYSAHLDHIGIRPSETGDEIHNGAYDNAAGIGTVLEIAAAMAAMPEAPRRSVIFALVTAEEKGLQGSSYFAKNPPVPVEQLVANINIDMPYLGFPVADIHAFGAEHSTLYAAVSAATEAMDVGLTPDPLPAEVRFVRSDQFSFVQEGIPALAFKAGSQSSDPAIDGAAALDDFLKNHYHQASDDLNLPWSEVGGERFARTALLLGLIVADQDERPVWNKGDFFGDKFAR